MGNQSSSSSEKPIKFEHKFTVENFSKYEFDYDNEEQDQSGIKKHPPSIMSENIALTNRALLANKLEAYLEVLPNGESQATEQFVGAYLHFSNYGKGKIVLQYSVSLMREDEAFETKDGEAEIEIAGRFGWSDFVSRKVLQANADRLLPNDKLTLRCEVTITKMSK